MTPGKTTTATKPKTVADAIDRAKELGGVQIQKNEPEKPLASSETPKLGVDPQELKEVQVQLPDPAGDEKAKQLDVIEPPRIQNNQIVFTPKHLDLIKTQIAKDATPEELQLFMMMSYRTRLDPLMKQLYFIKYGGKVNYVTSIDGYRIIAHRTGDFAGVDEPKFDYDEKGQLTHCSITVYKIVQGVRCGFSAKVKFSEYNTRQNNWLKMPETMIAKVAEAHALRKAFPNDLSGIYTQDEMDQASESQKPAPEQRITKAQFDKIKQLLELKEVESDTFKRLAGAYKRPSIGKLSMRQAGHFISELQKLPDPVLQEDAPEEGVVDSSFSAFVDSETENTEVMPDAEVDEISAGIEAKRAA